MRLCGTAVPLPIAVLFNLAGQPVTLVSSDAYPLPYVQQLQLLQRYFCTVCSYSFVAGQGTMLHIVCVTLRCAHGFLEGASYVEGGVFRRVCAHAVAHFYYVVRSCPSLAIFHRLACRARHKACAGGYMQHGAVHLPVVQGSAAPGVVCMWGCQDAARSQYLAGLLSYSVLARLSKCGTPPCGRRTAPCCVWEGGGCLGFGRGCCVWVSFSWLRQCGSEVSGRAAMLVKQARLRLRGRALQMCDQHKRQSRWWWD